MHTSSGFSVPFHAEAVNRFRPVDFVQRTVRVDEIDIAETTLANWRGIRSGAQARDRSRPRLVLAIGTEDAPLRVEQDERHVVGGRASVLPFWSIGQSTLTAEEPQTIRTVTVPLDAIGFPHVLLRDVLAEDIGGTPIAGLLIHHVDGVLRLDDVSATEATAVARATVELVRALLSTGVADEQRSPAFRRSPPFRRSPTFRRSLGIRIMLYVQANLTDAALSADSVAAAFGISRRYLYLVLSQLELSLADVVRRGRLQRAAEALEDPVNSYETIWAIGQANGFSDQSSFSRAFKSEYGRTPSEWRRGDRAHPAQNVAQEVNARQEGTA